MEEIILTSRNCYEGLDTLEDVWIIDSYGNLASNQDIDPDSIRYCSDAWDDEKAYFISFINNEIKLKERETGSTVVDVVMAGTVGLWNGTTIGGKTIYVGSLHKIFSFDVDEIDIAVDKSSREIIWLGYHHDGTHAMKLYLITEDELESLGLLEDYHREGESAISDVEFYEKVLDRLYPVTLDEGNNYFRI